MNEASHAIARLSTALDDLLAGKIDATKAASAAAIVSAQAKRIDAEVAMARHGGLLDVVKAEWTARLKQTT